MRKYPCDICRQDICDYRRCKEYDDWVCDAWRLFQRRARHLYWPAADREKLTYVHPDVIRRYLQEGPCGRCGCRDICGIPCESYWHWWDARMYRLKWRIENNTDTSKAPPVREGLVMIQIQQVLR